MFKATGDDWYRHYLVSNGVTLGGTTTAVNEFSWDSKYAGAQVLLAKVISRFANSEKMYLISEVNGSVIL